MISNMEVPIQATKLAGGEGSQRTDTQSANSPKLITPLEFQQAEEIERLEKTVTDLKKKNVKKLTGTVDRLLKKIENGELNTHMTKHSEKPLGTSADYSHRNQKMEKSPRKHTQPNEWGRTIKQKIFLACRIWKWGSKRESQPVLIEKTSAWRKWTTYQKPNSW